MELGGSFPLSFCWTSWAKSYSKLFVLHLYAAIVVFRNQISHKLGILFSRKLVTSPENIWKVLFVGCRGRVEHRTRALVFLFSRVLVRVPVMSHVSLSKTLTKRFSPPMSKWVLRGQWWFLWLISLVRYIFASTSCISKGAEMIKGMI